MADACSLRPDSEEKFFLRNWIPTLDKFWPAVGLCLVLLQKPRPRPLRSFWSTKLLKHSLHCRVVHSFYTHVFWKVLSAHCFSVVPLGLARALWLLPSLFRRNSFVFVGTI